MISPTWARPRRLRGTQTQDTHMEQATTAQQGNARNPHYKQYDCHKVWAAQITGISPTDSLGQTLLLHGSGPEGATPVNSEWMQRHKPEVGGYYVIYEDGYTSYSPQAAFEKGYTLKPPGIFLSAMYSEFWPHTYAGIRILEDDTVLATINLGHNQPMTRTRVETDIAAAASIIGPRTFRMLSSIDNLIADLNKAGIA